MLDLGGRFAAGEGLGWEEKGKREGKWREGKVEGREREGPQVTVEPGPLRDLLYATVATESLLKY